ncbi:MAG TPA: acetyl-CoA hydrolase/transferase C-terminal domain-containing protein [Actinomycetes bacterium]
MKTIAPDVLSSHLASLPENPRVVVSGNFALPASALTLLDAALPTYRLFVLNPQVGVPDREGVIIETPFVGPGVRRSPRLRYIPSRLSLAPVLFRTTTPPDVVLVHTSTPFEGTVSLGTEVNIMPAAVEAARERGALVVAQVNPQMPYTFGDAQLPVECVDLAIEVDEPLASPTPIPLDEVSLSIGERVAHLVNDGSTLQMGIGGVPDATLVGLTGRRSLRIWTEMFSDGVLTLDRAGALDPDRELVASFLFGSQELYRWLNHNRRVRVMRTEKVNDPTLIARNRQMVSVNTALQVDLFGQANASRINARIYSGFGGQTDFIVGSMHSVGGQALMALRSWHPKADVSTIVPLLDEPVTSFQQSAVVTEQGVAPLWGHSQHDQARFLIDQAAHPDVREELWEEAAALGLA